MSYTSYGEFMRILRVRFHEVMGDTAKLLGVSVPFVSSVESGKKNVPVEWIPKLINHYKLNEREQKELSAAVEESKNQMKINLYSASPAQRRLAVSFQRSFENLDADTAEAIMKLLKKERS
ncbi:MAG: helix-turn-helix domain-containing protein [Clostridia bacterium]|nr:helix-turn-helix domain-containing protein [Clostridia bacterium]